MEEIKVEIKSETVTTVVVADVPQEDTVVTRRPGEAPIKREFLKPADAIPRPPKDEPVKTDAPVEDGDDGKKKQRGTFKKRPVDAMADPADTLCRPVAAGGSCGFGDSCKFSHDLDDYMKRKEKDMGDECPVFAAYGFCRYGVACRFARSHTLRQEDGKWINQDTRPEDKRAVDPEFVHTSNALTDEVRQLLRKNKYPFRSLDQGKKGKKNRQGKDKRDNKPATEDTTATEENEATEPVEGAEADAKPEIVKSESPLLPERKPVDFKNKIYVAPLTTVGNLPFRRLLKKTGADITCGEMAMATNLLKAQQSEWALLRRHESEDVFGVQIAGAHGDQLARVCEMIARETDVDFIDINMGCPIDLVCRSGAGSALMTRPPRMMEVISGALTGIELGSFERDVAPGLTVKLRTGWSDKSPVAHKLVSKIQNVRASSIYMNASVVQDYKLRAVQGVDAIMVHGRSRLQRYTKNADWDYIFQCSDAQDSALPRTQFLGNGDVLSYVDFDEHLKSGKLETCMLGRGALIKPWLPIEIKERRHFDISASERFDLLKDFVRFGLEHWGSDQKGVNRTRRYLLEWQSFLCRYIPVGLLEVLPQQINNRPAPYYGRNDLETLMASDQAVDWVKISEMLLGPVPEGFQFQPKHKANAYARE
ncbi:hypothetical protein Poli38472_009016 [Pythium oligandrum]|uniref:tRNA-dihydrouridine(47) synthase [NAD(P)(+)] n=1 Tax=Pythium oligandrum TaxID=41045 RepID=A0A8K1CKQ1_PYTOL|nr:hypothetical protein Poli38472_009016 [Pythium oligandrum]|eukprot:TMW64849.1 hypothetical protein Poli38472_009016 [Pythium oligandrum]